MKGPFDSVKGPFDSVKAFRLALSAYLKVREHCGNRKCKRSVSRFDLEEETPKADGWARLVDMGAVPRGDVYFCPLHNMLVRDVVENEGVADPARKR